MAEITNTADMMKAFTDFLHNNPSAREEIKQEMDRVYNEGKHCCNTIYATCCIYVLCSINV